jgi:retinol dehydrogenase-14
VKTDAMKGKTVLLTGATSGIGKAALFALADMGARVVMLARDEGKARETIREIGEKTGNNEVEMIHCDLASLDLVRKAVEDFLAAHNRLDVLANNAGVMTGKRTLTADGFEYDFGVNHLSHFVLTNLLLNRLKGTERARVVVTSSYSQFRGHIDFDDLMSERSFRPFAAYGNSKLANTLFTFELARRLAGTDASANCFHPGTVRTNITRGLGRAASVVLPLATPFLLAPEKGAETLVYLASSPEVEGVTGKYFFEKKVTESSAESQDQGEARRLWEVSAALTARWLEPLD